MGGVEGGEGRAWLLILMLLCGSHQALVDVGREALIPGGVSAVQGDVEVLNRFVVLLEAGVGRGAVAWRTGGGRETR